MKRNKKSKAKKAAIVISTVILVVIAALYIVMPGVMGLVASTRGPAGQGSPPDGFEAVTLTASDGAELAAWYAAPQDGPCILLLHGSHGNKEAVSGYAQMLQGLGYGVLVWDLRGHGHSGGGGNALGWECDKDITAALDYLNAQNGVTSIGALGLSMGGEVLLGAASAHPEIKAIVSDGATHHTLADYLTLPENRSLWRSWTTRVMYLSAGLFTGQQPPAETMLDSIAGSGSTQFLFIAAGSVPDEISYNTLFADTAANRAELWTAPDAGHAQAFSLYPDDYQSRIAEFFSSVLAG